jgi:hypothetical protein
LLVDNQVQLTNNMANSQFAKSHKHVRGFAKLPADVQKMLLKAATNILQPNPGTAPYPKFEAYLQMEKNQAAMYAKQELNTDKNNMSINTNVSLTLYHVDIKPNNEGNDFASLNLFMLGPFKAKSGKPASTVITNPHIEEEFRRDQKMASDKEAKAAATVILSAPGNDVHLLIETLKNGVVVYSFVVTDQSAIPAGIDQFRSDIDNHKRIYMQKAANDFYFCSYILLIINHRIWRFLQQCRDLDSAKVDYGLMNFSDIIERIHDGASIARDIPHDILPTIEAARPKASGSGVPDAAGNGNPRKDGGDAAAKRKADKQAAAGGPARKPKLSPAEAAKKDNTLIEDWLLRSDENFVKFLSKGKSAPKLHGTTPCLNKWIKGSCKQGDKCPRKKSHEALDKDSDEFKKFGTWVEKIRSGEE